MSDTLTSISAESKRKVARVVLATAVGPLTLQATKAGLCRLDFGEVPMVAPEEPEGGPAHVLLGRAVAEVKEYLDGARRAFGVPLDLEGRGFRLRVWQALCRIPYGQTRTYGQVAEEVGSPRGARAVGQSTGANPVAIVIPCHRVVGARGGMGGFGGGLVIKSYLLGLERKVAGCELPVSALAQGQGPGTSD